MNDELVDLAQATQRRHAELIAEAQRRTSTEARREVRDDLDVLRQEFTAQAMRLTGVNAPYLWLPENPDHAVALAVRRDIADTEEQLSRLANGEAFQKFVVTSSKDGYGKGGSNPLSLGLGVLGAILILVAVLVVKR